MSTQAVCKNGHVATSKVIDVQNRTEMKDAGVAGVRYVDVDLFCRACGAPVIVKCEDCEAPLENPPWGSMKKPTDNAFCPRCGSAFPWATREQRIGQLVALLEHEHLDEVTRLAAIEAITELAVSEPEDEDAQVASAGRLQRLVPAAWNFMVPVVQGLLTDGAKRKLGLS